MRRLNYVAALALGALIGASVQARADDNKPNPVAKDVGNAVGTAAREVGQGAKKVTKEVGHAVEEAARETGHFFRDGAREVKKAVQNESGKK